MNVHFLTANDSDDDSWIEVVEGSPGPSLPASPTFRPVNNIENALIELELNGSISRTTETPGSEQTIDANDAENTINHKSHSQLSLSSHSPVEQNTAYLMDISLPQRIPIQSSLHSTPRLDRPEIGDIIRHFHDVYGICLTRPEEGKYYQSWLCWMYGMAWNQIWVLVSRAPDCVVHAANHLFGLRNHPFWSNIKGLENEWLSMHAACLDILTWWEENRFNAGAYLNGEGVSASKNIHPGIAHSHEIKVSYDLSNADEERVNSDQTKTIITAEEFLKVNRRIAEYEKTQKAVSDNHNESYDNENRLSCSNATTHSSKSTGEDKYTSPSEETRTPYAPLWPPQQVIDYVTSKYNIFDQRTYEELNSYDISFETWVRWNEYVRRGSI